MASAKDFKVRAVYGNIDKGKPNTGCSEIIRKIEGNGCCENYFTGTGQRPMDRHGHLLTASLPFGDDDSCGDLLVFLLFLPSI